MHFFEKLLSIDCSKLDLSSIEQLVFIKISYYCFYGLSPTLPFLAKSCGCSKPTLLLSISKLEGLGILIVFRSKGVSNSYSLNDERIKSLIHPELAGWISHNRMVQEFNEPTVQAKANNKNKNKRKRKNRKR